MSETPPPPPPDRAAASLRQALPFWLKLGFISFGGPAGQIAVMWMDDRYGQPRHEDEAPGRKTQVFAENVLHGPPHDHALVYGVDEDHVREAQPAPEIDPSLAARLKEIQVVKYRLLRTLIELPVLTREIFEEQIAGDFLRFGHRELRLRLPGAMNEAQAVTTFSHTDSPLMGSQASACTRTGLATMPNR